MSEREKRRKRRKILLEIFIMTAFVTLGIILILGVIHIYMKCNIYINQNEKESISQEIELLQEQIDISKKEQEEYKVQMEHLQIELAKKQDIVIPDSMQSK